ncbi:hypothetical protein [Cerasicoccus frondis]|uniref:hypothetical protein n=1 Tax=Cerasicoccus frondis TaxID=490090 RepID=UPI002852653A|nr:hypothetical protein [Cerasicoccus frondis]
MSVDNRYQNAFALWLGESPLNADELDALRLRAWREQGILITAVADDRLTNAEKIGLCRIANRLYGPNGADPIAA